MNKSFFRFWSILFIFIATVSVSGCALFSMPLKDHGLNANLVEKDYKILGRVEYTGYIQNVLGFITWGGPEYTSLYAKAKKDFGADDVINLSVDYNALGIGLIYNSRGYTMSGLAIKYK